MKEVALFFDKGLHEVTNDIVVCGDPLFGYIHWWIVSLPISFGSLGLYLVVKGTSYDFVALRDQSWVFQDHILRDNNICGTNSDYVCTLSSLCNKFSDINLSSFTAKDTAPSQSQNTLAGFIFNKIVQYMEVHFDMMAL